MGESTPATTDEAADRPSGMSSATAANGPSALVTWCFGAFHVAALTVVTVLVLQHGGAVGASLAGLDTAVGLGLYGFLWVITWWTTRRGLRAAWHDERGLAWIDGIESALAWGGATGVVFFGGLVAALVVLRLAQGMAAGSLLQSLVVVGLLGGAVAGLVGALVGGLLGLLDLALLWAARTLDAPLSNGHD